MASDNKYINIAGLNSYHLKLKKSFLDTIGTNTTSISSLEAGQDATAESLSQHLSDDTAHSNNKYSAGDGIKKDSLNDASGTFMVDFGGTGSSNKVSRSDHTHSKADITDFPELSTVATSGKYSDLSGLPPLGTAAAKNIGDFAAANHNHTGIIDYTSKNLICELTQSSINKAATWVLGWDSTDQNTGIAKFGLVNSISLAGNITGGSVYGAVFNDFTDSIEVPEETKLDPGYCYCTDGEHYYKSSEYLQMGVIGIHSDTSGINTGKKRRGKEIDVAVAGFVLAYVDKVYPSGTPLTCTKNGYLTEIQMEDKIKYPERIIGTFWKKETAEIWEPTTVKVKVNGRHWVKIK